MLIFTEEWGAEVSEILVFVSKTMLSNAVTQQRLIVLIVLVNDIIDVQ